MRAGKGFTIVELLIVIVVIAILASVTLVAYTGIRSQAEHTALLNNMDRWEKAFLLEKAETGQATVWDFARPDYKTTNPDPDNPHYTETSSAYCLPGDYPAEGPFREGECKVIISHFQPDDGSPGFVYNRTGVIERPESDFKWTGLQVGTFANLPDFPRGNVVSSTASAHYNSNIATGGPESGIGTFTIHTRGAYITVMLSKGSIDTTECYDESNTPIPGKCFYPVDTLYVGYRVAGDQQCGRGNKVATPTVWNRETLITFYDKQVQQLYGQSFIEYLTAYFIEEGVNAEDVDEAVEEYIQELLDLLNGPNSGQSTYETVGAAQYVTSCTIRIGDINF